MRFNQTEIIEEMEGLIRKRGGAWGEWCVGTAKDTHAPFFQRHLAEDLGDGLAYREAFTTNVAEAVVAHLVNDRGLEIDRAAAHAALPDPQFVQEKPPHPGRTLFGPTPSRAGPR